MEGTLWSLYQRQAPRFQLSRGMALSVLAHVLVVVVTIVLPSLHTKRSVPMPFYTVDLVSSDQLGFSANPGPVSGGGAKAVAPKATPAKGPASVPAMPVERLRAQSLSTPVTPLKKLDHAVEPEQSAKNSTAGLDKSLDKLIPKPKAEKEPPPPQVSGESQKTGGGSATQGQPEPAAKSVAGGQGKGDGDAHQKPAAGGGTGPGPAGGGAGSTSGDPRQISLALGLYSNQIMDMVRRGWSLDVNRLKGQHLEAIITLLVRRDGKILKVHFEKKSGNVLLDETAERAVRKLEGLPPFPKIFSPPEAEIELRFRPEELG